MLSQPYDGRPGCNYCNNCARGCPRLDKGSADVTFMRHAMATGKCTLLTEAPVFRIEAGPAGRIHSVAYMHRGNAQAVRTRALVLACGAVETPRRSRVDHRRILVPEVAECGLPVAIGPSIQLPENFLVARIMEAPFVGVPVSRRRKVCVESY